MTTLAGVPPLRFDLDAVERAHRERGANCGPTAIAAVLGRTLDEVRPHMGDFERKRYTNPTLMYQALRSLGAAWVPLIRRGDDPRPIRWPRLGLVRVQWEGPWTAPGVPLRARYRHTHWIGAATSGDDQVGIWDCNAMANGTGWAALADWDAVIVPWILSNSHPRANGRWHKTHVLDLSDSHSPPVAECSAEED